MDRSIRIVIQTRDFAGDSPGVSILIVARVFVAVQPAVHLCTWRNATTAFTYTFLIQSDDGVLLDALL